MAKQIGEIRLHSVEDLHLGLGVNERTVRDWFKKGRLKGQKVGKEWYITEENLRRFFNGEKESGQSEKPKKKKKKKKKKKGFHMDTG